MINQLPRLNSSKIGMLKVSKLFGSYAKLYFSRGWNWWLSSCPKSLWKCCVTCELTIFDQVSYWNQCLRF